MANETKIINAWGWTPWSDAAPTPAAIQAAQAANDAVRGLNAYTNTQNVTNADNRTLTAQIVNNNPALSTAQQMLLLDKVKRNLLTGFW